MSTNNHNRVGTVPWSVTESKELSVRLQGGKAGELYKIYEALEIGTLWTIGKNIY